MSPRLAADLPTLAGFPRVSGDEPSLVATVASKIGFSPRERG